MLRKLVASLCILLVCGLAAQAGVMGVLTPVANPPGTPFVTDTDLNSPPNSDVWRSYILGVRTDDGSKVSALDVALTGEFHQRWTFNEDTGTFQPTPASTNVNSGDSHLIPGAVVAAAATENNNMPTTRPTGTDTATRDYGVGTTLTGAWGYDPTQQTAQVAGQPVNFAYIVIPVNTQPTFNIVVSGATNPSQPIPLFTLDTGDFFGGVTAPTITDATIGPLATDTASPITHQFAADQAIQTWTLTSLIGPAGAAPTFTPSLSSTGGFSWAATKADLRGGNSAQWVATVMGQNANGSDSGTLTINLVIPEPATLSLVGLAMIGLVGLVRRRS